MYYCTVVLQTACVLKINDDDDDDDKIIFTARQHSLLSRALY